MKEKKKKARFLLTLSRVTQWFSKMALDIFLLAKVCEDERESSDEAS